MLFTRVPVSGLVKTRLGTCIVPEQCAALQEALVLDLAERISKGFDQIVLCYSDEWMYVDDGLAIRDAFLSSVVDACGSACRVHMMEQRGSNLGERLVVAMNEVFNAGADGCVLFGSDLPDVNAADVREAQKALEHCDVVLGPGLDGGYWIVGLKAPFPELFTQRAFSTVDVLDDALATCRQHGKVVRLIRTASDIDEPENLAALKDGSISCGPRTQKVLGLIG